MIVQQDPKFLESERKKQFEGLVSRIFSPHNLEVSVSRGDYADIRSDYIDWELSRKHFRFPGFIDYPKTLIKVSPQSRMKNGLMPQIFEDGDWKPINIHIYDRTLDDSGIQFAQEYETLSGQEAKVFQNYAV